MKVIWVLIAVFNSGFCQKDDTLALIKSAGYKGASYRVETEDGYVLKVHRVKPANGLTTKPPVFLQHGLFVASSDWLLTGKKIALAYLLSDNGYDVWLGNVRGNKYSERHKTLKPSMKKFWDFSFHEMGYYDMPVMFDLMMNMTGAKKAFLVGHSQGTSTLMSFLATRPEYVPKVIQVHLMSPAVIMKHVPHPIISPLAAEANNGFFRGYNYVNLGSIVNVAKDFMRMFCTERNRDSLAFCSSVLFTIVGPNRYGNEIDDRIYKTLITHVSQRVSVKQLMHFVQLYRSGSFQMFDYKQRNRARYNQTTAPLYNLKAITTPVSIYAATEDWIISPVDAAKLRSLLPNSPKLKVISNWNHLDFTYGKNARKVLYNEILADFESALN